MQITTPPPSAAFGRRPRTLASAIALVREIHGPDLHLLCTAPEGCSGWVCGDTLYVNVGADLTEEQCVSNLLAQLDDWTAAHSATQSPADPGQPVLRYASA